MNLFLEYIIGLLAIILTIPVIVSILIFIGSLHMFHQMNMYSFMPFIFIYYFFKSIIYINFFNLSLLIISGTLILSWCIYHFLQIQLDNSKTIGQTIQKKWKYNKYNI